MNKIAISLYVIGVLAIIGGIVNGFVAYQIPLDGYQYLTEKDYTVLITWIAAGVISGIMMFGFAEIIKLLSEKKYLNEVQITLIRDLKDELKDIKKGMERGE
ncbi:hypothetical protein CWR48_10670 [Oceanobacillus arenosus]|uniref:Uncharacterized protein n=1 Tax=Oceanobacillus arenosus TaxID=1229153 RepID=A0A3D8PSB5_9BACI|nr:hypothetical protein [Oceanobacillus arenosus]RDW18059.1 hypothetical protein CWR48_10670 [Oceanobacillus arenosus]